MQATNDSLNFMQGEEIKKIIPTPRKTDANGKWHIPDQQTFEACKAEAERLHAKHPEWDSDKLARKVAEKFKLKINSS